MSKLKMHTPNATEAIIAKVAEFFPECVVEAQDDKGRVIRSIDFDELRQHLSNQIVDGQRERYHLDWPGKREALLTANAPIAKTLRPQRDESVNFDSTKNIVIEGDNLDALKLLQETYLNRVNMIYIDPPYNTGNDFVYNDDFTESADNYLVRSNQQEDSGTRLVANTDSNGRFHSDWLSMLYPRLRLARNLLAEDGVIFISIDDNEAADLKKLCDEVFGEQNFVAQLIWKKAYGGGAKSKHAVVLHEYVLMYAKNKIAVGVIELPPNNETLKYYKYKDDKFAVRGPFRKQPLATNSMDDRENLRYPIPYKGETIWPAKQWQWQESRAIKALADDELVITKNDDGWTVDYKQYLKDEDGKVRGSKLYSMLDGPFTVMEGPYTQAGTAEIEELFGNGKVFPFPKPSSLIKHLLQCSSPDAIALDFFAGSGSTAQAIMALNADDGGRRRFLLVQLPEKCDEGSEAFKAGFKTIADITKERVRRCGKLLKEQAGLNGEKLDIGFRVLKVDTSNMKDVYYEPDAVNQATLDGLVDNVKGDRTDEDLLIQILLDWGVDLTLSIKPEIINGKTVHFVDTNAVAACFDSGIDEAFIKELAKKKPLRAVFRDAAYGSDATKINVEQIFKLLSPATEVKSI